MAESWRAKANRYARGDFTNTELKIIVGGLLFDQAIDVATFGRLSQLKGKALQRVILPLLTRAAPRAGLSVAGAALGASRILMTNPYVLGATALYVGVTERERIKQLLDQGYEIVKEEVAPPVSQFMQEQVFTPEAAVRARARGTIGLPSFVTPPRRRPSKFNKAVSAGMKAVKKSKSYGGIGKISPATKVFSIVTKLAAAKKKKKKAPKSGIRRRIWTAMKGLR
jgi:hypothetical protein